MSAADAACGEAGHDVALEDEEERDRRDGCDGGGGDEEVRRGADHALPDADVQGLPGRAVAELDEQWLRNVHEAARELDRSSLPTHLRPGAKNLFRHMILQNAGVHRRQAIETVVTSGWTEPIARALGSLLRSEQNEAWQIGRAHV